MVPCVVSAVKSGAISLINGMCMVTASEVHVFISVLLVNPRCCLLTETVCGNEPTAVQAVILIGDELNLSAGIDCFNRLLSEVRKQSCTPEDECAQGARRTLRFRPDS